LRPVIQALTKRRPFPYDFAGRCEYAADSPHGKSTRKSLSRGEGACRRMPIVIEIFMLSVAVITGIALARVIF
jgi:hypothetical protein